MRRTLVAAARGAALVAGLLAASGALAGGKLTKLPGDYVFVRGDGSPGPVTFSHGSHVDAARPSCVTCHPARFRILESGRTASGDPIRHQQMEAGAGCGSCHGKTAFGFDSCDTCHRQ